jgi:hypothetical protein
MDLADRLPTMTDKDLVVLLANAERLGRTGTGRRKEDATRLCPLIIAEQEARKAAKPTAPGRASHAGSMAARKRARA